MPLKVAAPLPGIERWVKRLAARFDRERVDSRLLMRGAAPFVTASRTGRVLRQTTLVRELFRNVKTHQRTPVTARLVEVAPAITRTRSAR